MCAPEPSWFEPVLMNILSVTIVVLVLAAIVGVGWIIGMMLFGDDEI